MMKRLFIILFSLIFLQSVFAQLDLNFDTCTSSYCSSFVDGSIILYNLYYSPDNVLYYSTVTAIYNYKYSNNDTDIDLINHNGFHLDSLSCDVNSVQFIDNYNIKVESNLYSPYTSQYNLIGISENLLNDYYYMKAFAFVKVELPNGETEYLKPDTINGDYSYGSSGTYTQLSNLQDTYYKEALISLGGQAPYILLKPETVSISFEERLQKYKNLCEEEPTFGSMSSSYCGDYKLTYYVVPIDGKCDFNIDGLLNSGELPEFKPKFTEQRTISITNPNSDNDFDGIINALDIDPDNFGPEILGGGVKLYGEVECIGTMTFNSYTNKLNCDSDLFKFDAIYDCNNGDKDDDCDWTTVQNDDASIAPNKYSGRYLCVDDHPVLDYEEISGYCDLTYNGPLPGEELANIKINDIDKTLTYDDTYTINKVIVDYSTNNAYYINEDGIKELITLPVIEDKEIVIYKNGVNIKNETIRPEYIALNAHQIELSDNKAKLEQFIDKSYTLMTKLNITKEITTNGVTSIIKIKLQVPASDRVNLTVYQTIPKSQASDYSNINFINNAGAQLIVLDKDPVIGWYFNESDGTEEIEYELPGDTEGGVIIITQEPILYNEGELIINYRENNCNADEAHLFDLDDLVDSNTYFPGSAFYKVCVAHLDENLASVPDVQTLNISSYNNGALMNMSQDLANKVKISTSNPNLYWSMHVQKTNPNGNYSCLGSVNDKENPSLFGDCGYNQENRIWIHLGEDYYPPTTDISYPYVAHTMKISLVAQDNVVGSGLKDSYYCIKDDLIDCSNLFDYTLYTKEILLSCENTWGCVKSINVYSTDIAGNVETPKTKVVTIIDEGSSCESDCTVKPSPNRFLAACRNMNGCNYYSYNVTGDFDDGEYVANQCNYLTENSWAFFNSTHEIKCPNGPFRRSRFTFETLYFTSNRCENMQIIDYPVLIEGTQVKMKILYCADYD